MRIHLAFGLAMYQAEVRAGLLASGEAAQLTRRLAVELTGGLADTRFTGRLTSLANNFTTTSLTGSCTIDHASYLAVDLTSALAIDLAGLHAIQLAG